MMESTSLTVCYCHIIVVPHIGPFAISDGPANWGDMVSATCSIMKGDFPVKIVWTFNGQPISLHDSDITITNINKHMSALSIESVTARHAGEYTCVATNRAGNVSHSTTLVVNGTYISRSTHARQLNVQHLPNPSLRFIIHHQTRSSHCLNLMIRPSLPIAVIAPDDRFTRTVRA